MNSPPNDRSLESPPSDFAPRVSIRFDTVTDILIIAGAENGHELAFAVVDGHPKLADIALMFEALRAELWHASYPQEDHPVISAINQMRGVRP